MARPPRSPYDESQEQSELEISAITDADEQAPVSRGLGGFVGRLFRLPWVGSEPVDHDRGRELRRAVRAEDIARVRKMLRDGVGVNQSQEASLACIATRRQNLELLDVLIGAGADLDTGDRRNRSSRTRTPLQEASRKGWLDGIDALVRAGADLECMDETGATALTLAVRSGKHHASRRLLAAGANARGGDEARMTPMHEAVTADMGSMLLEYGADINARDRAGATPLHHQAKAGRLAMVEFCLNNGAQLDALDGRGRGVLFFPGGKGEALLVFKHLVAAGANKELRDGEMNTWSHFAATRCSNPKVLEWVYEQSPDHWFLKNKSGETPWDLITSRGFLPLSQRIRSDQEKRSLPGALVNPSNGRPEFNIFQPKK